MPRRLGQHFLADHRALERIADALRLDRADVMLEIGAGRGALTDLLAERAGLVLAVELDPPLANALRERYAAEPRVRVIETDVLALDLRGLIESGPGRAKVAGNLPYYITSPILMRLFESAALFDAIVVLVQLEVAHRITAAPGSRDYGLLSVTAQYYTRPELLFRVPAGAFRPPPEVESAVVRMTVAPRGRDLGITDDKAFLRFVAACFRQKRKTLRNNLRGLLPPDRLAEMGSRRAEEMTLEQFAELFRYVR